MPFSNLFTDDFVDIHSPLLPEIDDGTKNIDQSILLIEKLRNVGIKHFIITPHILGEVYPNTPEIIREQLHLLKEELFVRGMDDISINAAAEYMLDDHFLRLLKAKKLLTLKDNYVL